MDHEINLDFEEDYHSEIFGGKAFYLSYYLNDYNKIDPLTSYVTNKYGFRSPEFTSSDILVSGCSFTFGVGVPNEAAWGNVVGAKLGESVASLALPGWSIYQSVDRIFTYFRLYGHPKKLFCLFPDLARLPYVVDNEVLGDKSKKDHLGVFISYADNSDTSPKFIKKPYDISYISTEENSTYFSIRAIRNLEQYCNSVGIEFLWSTWDKPFTNIANQLKTNENFSFNNYFSIYDYDCNYYLKGNKINKQTIFNSLDELDHCESIHRNEECFCGLDCHLDIIDLYGKESFYIGTDAITNGPENAHFGTHMHAHVAEAFLKHRNAIYI
jgi:hypothetical protein